MERNSNITARDSALADMGAATPSSGVVGMLQQIERHLAAIREQLPAAPREWLTVEEVAEELRVSQDTVERLIAAGRLKATQVTTANSRGRRYRYRVRRKWIDEYGLKHLKRAASTAAPRRRRKAKPPVDFIG